MGGALAFYPGLFLGFGFGVVQSSREQHGATSARRSKKIQGPSVLRIFMIRPTGD